MNLTATGQLNKEIESSHQGACCSCHDHAHEHVHSHEHVHEHDHSCNHPHDHTCEHESSHKHSHGSSCSHSHGGSCGCGHSHVNFKTNKTLKYKFAIATLLFLAGLALRFTMPHLAFYGVSAFIPLFVLSWFFAGCDVLIMPFKNFSKGIIFDENFLMSIATIGAFVLGDWTEAASVMLFYNLGEIAQDAIVEKARGSITHLVDVNSSFARTLKEGVANSENLFNDSLYEVQEPEHVQIGTLLLIKPGEKVPLDATVIDGTSELNTASMTGESMPRLVKAGDDVLAGFINLTGLLVVKTKALLKDSEASRMLHLIEEASERKAKTEKLITSFAKVYTPIVLLASLLISIVPPLVLHFFFAHHSLHFATFAPWIHRGLVFLVISCPCAFILSVPLAYFAGIGAFARAGILVKGADYIDGLSKVKRIIFDKTGTLTCGKLKVVNILPSAESNEEELLKYAVLAEANSNHPIALSIREEGERRGENFISSIQNIKTEEYSEIAGRGIQTKVEGKVLAVGSLIFIEEMTGTKLQKPDAATSYICVSFDGKYLGTILLEDEVKEDAKATIETLKNMGIKDVGMLTGDAKENAERVASLLGITDYKAELLPSEKVEYFVKEANEFRARDKKISVAFVGDGINDAAVISASDVGIALGGSASDAAIQASDVVLMSDNTMHVAKSIKLAKRTRRIVKENIFISFAIKIGFLLLGSLGLAGLQIAVLADVGVALLATLNSLRLKGKQV